MHSHSTETGRVETGIAGLDEILHGGLIARRAYLIQGGPGTGKTTLGNHFLAQDAPDGNLFVTLGETADQLRDNARRCGLNLDDVPILDVSPMEQSGEDEPYNLLESWELEGGGVHDQLMEYARAHRPQRVFIDSLSQLRYLTPDAFQFRKQVLSLLRQLTAMGATVVFTAERVAGTEDDELQFLSDGVIQLRHVDSGRVCTVTKLRGSGFATGQHHYILGDGGLRVFPQLVPADHGQRFVHEAIPSGIAGLDAMTHGGIERGTVTVLSGPSGVGKTSLGAHFMREAAERGERSVIYSFDEGMTTFTQRLTELGMPVESLLEHGTLGFHYIEPLRENPDRFALRVREAVERDGVSVVMLDSLSGYRQSIPGGDMVERVHALGRYLVNMGVTVILVNEVQAVAGGELRATQDGISYLADTILLMRYVEHEGELRKSIGVLKKRTSDFDKNMRELRLTPEGIRIDGPMRVIEGVLQGNTEPPQASSEGGDGAA